MLLMPLRAEDLAELEVHEGAVTKHSFRIIELSVLEMATRFNVFLGLFVAIQMRLTIEVLSKTGEYSTVYDMIQFADMIFTCTVTGKEKRQNIISKGIIAKK